MIGPKGASFSGFDRCQPVDVKSLVKIGLLANSSQTIGPKGLKFSGFDGGLPGVVIILNLFVYLFNNSSQIIRPIGLNFSCFDWGHPGVVIRKFGKD